MISIISLLALPAVQAHAYECAHDQVHKSIKMSQSDQIYEKSGAYSPIRLKFVPDYTRACTSVAQVISTYPSSCSGVASYTCTVNDIMNSDKQAYWTSLLDSISTTISSTLSVIPVASTLSISTTKCCQASIANQQTHTGTDLVIFVHFMPSVLGSNVLAFASACELDSTGRPVAGFINVSPRGLFVGNAQDDSKTLLHELSHVLGFSQSVLSRRGINLVSKTKLDGSNGGAGRTVKEIQTPTVVAKVQEHFGCSSATGAEVEDFDSSFGHWEKNIFVNEYMTGWRDETENPMSAISLALFQDLGVYQVNWNNAQNYIAGKNKGCTWLNDKCSTRAAPNFCSQSTQNLAKSCTFDRKAIGFCDRVTYSAPLPSQYQYFSSPYDGGSNAMNNYCPTVTAFTNLDCTEEINGSPTNDARNGQGFASSSRCFTSSAYTVQFYGVSITGDSYLRCHRTECQADGRVKIYLGPGLTDYLYCPAEGGAVDIYTELKKLNPTCVETSSTTRTCTKYFGFLSCPVAAEICTGSAATVNAASPTPSPLPSATPSPSSIPSATPSVSIAPSPSASASKVPPTPSRSAIPSPSASSTAVPSVSPTITPTQSRVPIPSVTATASPSVTQSPSRSPSRSRTHTRSVSPTRSRTPSRSVSRTRSPSRTH